MATVTKDFKVKNGLIVEGTTGTINNHDILTKKQDDQDYIVGLIGGSSDSANTPNTVVKRDGSGNFAAGEITADLVGDVTGQVSDISNHDTDELDEGSTNKYFTNTRAREAISASGVMNYNSTTGDIALSYYTGLTNNDGKLEIDRTTVDNWYDANGAASDVQDNLDTHTNASSAHNTIGNIVGTENTQTLLNKTIGDVLTFNDGMNNSTIDVDGNNLYVTANNNLQLSTANGNILLNPDGYAYVGSASAGNEIATNSYADNAVDSHNDLTSGVHGVTGDVVGTTDSQTISNKTLGGDLAAGGYKVSGLATPTANADAATKSYVDTAVSNLVDSAPALLDTLNELAAAIADNPNYASDISTSLGTKVAKAGDSMSGNLDFGGTNKVTSLAAPTSNGDAANKLYVDDAASTAESNANDYTNNAITALDLAGTYDALGAAATAESNANSFTTSAINALDTDAIEEGSNKYFTNDYKRK